MALTQPRLGQLLTNVAIFTDSMTVLHGGATTPNVDVGFVFNRANGLVPNAAFYWSESTQSYVTALTANAGVTASNITVQSYANLTVGNLLMVQGSILGVVGNLQLGNLIANTGLYANTASISSNMYVGGNVQVAGAFIGNVTLGTVPSSPNNLYTVAPLNLINSQSATLKTQLNLINTGGSGGAGSAIDFYTYTGVGNGIPGARFGAIDDNNYGATFQWFIKADGNNGNNNLQSVLSVNQLGNVVIPGTTTSSSTTTGALVVAGGAGISGNLWAGNLITASGVYWSNGAAYSSGSSFNPASPGTIGGTTPGAATFSSLKTTQSTVTLGTSAGAISQGTYAIGIGTYAGYNTQGAYSVVIGGQAGQNTAGAQSVLIGYNAGFNSNNANVVSVGSYAGTQYQGAGAVAIGPGAGSTNQATNAVAIGNQAGVVQSASSVILNATGSQLNDNGVAGFFVKPTRNDITNIGNVVMYNTATGEHTYANTITIAGNITRGPTLVSDISNTITSIGTGATAIDAFANTAIRTAKYVVSTLDIISSQSQATEILLAQDGANVSVVTYGIIYTGTSQRMTFSANMSSGTITLWATGTSSNNTVKLSRTAIPM